ncbi:MAG TPA: type II toxin-antitoxin system death-on-curing family toxin [Solirubrobacteraceae bacterium]|nr:type II toxin-antitoxin system death-on-curing family toxin [Solirubrobacteraceae bacterium]
MRRIEIRDFLLIAELHCGIKAERLARIPRVMMLGQAALAAPFAGFDKYEAFPTLHEKAAVYCARIVTYHPLPDGNMRTAYDVMREFLERNGAVFEHPPGGLDATAEIIENVATNVLDERGLAAWLRERISS